MKKTSIFLAVAMFATTMFSQNVFQIGGNISKQIGKEAGANKYAPGYQVGITKDWGKFISIQPGIFLIHKGNRYEAAGGTWTTNLNYLQVPINVKVNFNLGKMRLYAGLGVYGSLGLWSNIRKGSEKVDFKFGTDIKRGDYGGQVMAGVMFGRFGVNVAYQPGLMNLPKAIDRKVTNSSLMLNLAFMLSDPEKSKSESREKSK